MKKSFQIIIGIMIFFSGLIAADSLADTVPGGCAKWDSVCSGALPSSISVSFEWNSFDKNELKKIRSDCTLNSVVYSIEITGLGTIDTGALTSYTWADLNSNASYQWRNKATYQCAEPGRNGFVWTDYYSFTTPTCCNLNKTGNHIINFSCVLNGYNYLTAGNLTIYNDGATQAGTIQMNANSCLRFDNGKSIQLQGVGAGTPQILKSANQTTIIKGTTKCPGEP